MIKVEPSPLMIRKLATILLSIVIALFILSAAIAVPLYWRGFYYGQIDKLNLVQGTGYSEETIRAAFDEMMDYCMGGGESAGLTFGTGELTWSEEGKAHFDDCAKLFALDKYVFLITLVILLVVIAKTFFTGRKGTGPSEFDKADEIDGFGGIGEHGESEAMARMYPARILGRGPLFWGALILLGLVAALAIIAILDFDGFFTAFHHTFFPGKDNWIFDPARDEIIKILPEQFFMNCAILIGVVTALLSLVSIAADFVLKSKHAKLH